MTLDNESITVSKQKKLVTFIIISFLVGNVLSTVNFSGGRRNSRFALIVSTSNDFPNANPPAYNVDGFPAQALQAYYALKRIGYDDEHIVLMVYHEGDDFVDYNRDGKNDLTDAIIDLENGNVTKDNVKKELQKIKYQLGYNDELLIYLINHGGGRSEDTAYLCFECGDILYEEELGSWLNEIFCERVIVLADFCSSGNFISSLTAPGRICISSCEGNKVSWYYWDFGKNLSEDDKDIFGDSGSVFFHPFWVKVEQGYYFEDAFSYANHTYRRWINIEHSIEGKEVVEIQNPQIIVKDRGFVDEIWRFLMFLFSWIIRLLGLTST